MPQSRRIAAFTLIELLVVVAIIALLIALLLPALAKAKEVSRRSICLANLHALNNAMRVYSSQFGDQAPIGLSFQPNDADSGARDWREQSYLYWAQSNSYAGSGVNTNYYADFLGLGRLYQIGAVMAQKIYFCPSGLANGALPRNFYPTWGQWPILDIRNQSGFWPQGYTFTGQGWPASYSGYSRRPSPPSSDSTWGTPTYLAWRFVLSTPAPYNFVPQAGGGYGARYPKFNELGSIAIIADLAGGEVYVDAVHKSGMNVAYADGSCSWVPRSSLVNPTTGVSDLAPAASYPFNSTAYNSAQVNTYNVPLWQDFDRR